MRVIKLTDQEPMKWFHLQTPDKVTVCYDNLMDSVYFDAPGYFMAFVATDIEGKNYLKVEKV
jgi:hypothetical protein